MTWHNAAPVGRGARIIQFLVLGLVSAVVGPVGVGVVLSDGDVRFTVTNTELVVDVDPGILASQRRVPLSSIEGVELASAPLGVRTRGTGKPGHCSGWFRRGELGHVWEASACTEETVIVRVPGETWTLGPADREGFVAALKDGTPGVFDLPVPRKVSGWWRALQVLMVALLALPFLMLAAILIPVRFAASQGTLYVRSPFGTRRFEVAGAAATRVDDYKIGLRLFGMGYPGAWFGLFRVDGETTHLWVSQRRGPAILIDGPKRVIVNPEDPEALLSDLLVAGARRA